jgi:hypothetical protein
MEVRQFLRIADLPNRDGFKFTGVKHDGTFVQCNIVKGFNGYFISGEAKYGELKGWIAP